MSQDVKFEYTSEGPERLILGDQSFDIIQRSVKPGDHGLEEAGLVSREISGFSGKILDGASRVNRALSITASRVESPVNVFWFDLGERRNDLVFLNVPFQLNDGIKSAFVMLSMNRGDGQKFMDAMHNTSMDQDSLREVLTGVIRLKRSQKVPEAQIVTTNLVYMSGSSYPWAEWANRYNVQLTPIPQDMASQIHMLAIPEPTVDLIPLDDFVAQSIFFREDKDVS